MEVRRFVQRRANPWEGTIGDSEKSWLLKHSTRPFTLLLLHPPRWLGASRVTGSLPASLRVESHSDVGDAIGRVRALRDDGEAVVALLLPPAGDWSLQAAHEIRRQEPDLHLVYLTEREDDEPFEGVLLDPMLARHCSLLACEDVDTLGSRLEDIARKVAERDAAPARLTPPPRPRPRVRREPALDWAGVVGQAADPVFYSDVDGTILEWNAAAERRFGWVPNGPQPRLEQFAGCPPLRGVKQTMVFEAHYGDARLELQLTPLRGRERGGGFLAVTREPSAASRSISDDVRELASFQQREGTRWGFAKALAESRTLEEASQRVLQTVCKSLGWACGAVWLIEPDGQLLRCAESWQMPLLELDEFRRATHEMRLRPGQGLPGQAWEANDLVWIGTTDDTEVVGNRPAGLHSEHVRSGMAVPLKSASNTVGVVEFFSKTIPKPDADMRRLMGGLAGQLGEFIDRLRTAEALRASQERLRMALDAGQMGTFDWHLESATIRWSPGLERIHGMEPGTFGGTYADAQHDVHLDDRQRVSDTIKAALDKEDDFIVEYRIQRRDGKLKWVEARGRPVFDASGRITEVTGVCLDVTARKRSEEALRVQADASLLLRTSLDYESTLRAVPRLAVPRLADWCALDLMTDDRTLRRMASAHKDNTKRTLLSELQRNYGPDKNPRSPSRTVVAERQSIVMTSMDEETVRSHSLDDRNFELLNELGTRSLLCVPLLARGQVLGALTFISTQAGRYSSDDLPVAEELALRALAVDNARLYQRELDAQQMLASALEHERDLVQTLVESFLGRRPTLDSVEVATLYQPAFKADRVGGDYFDFIQFDDGRVGLIIGDVSGKGLKAGVYTAMAKYTLRAYANEDPAPANVFNRLNQSLYKDMSEEGMFLTLFYAVLDPRTGEMVFANAGHPAPVVYDAASGACSRLEVTGGILGAIPELEYTEDRAQIGPGGVLALFTDGVTEAGGVIDPNSDGGVGDVLQRLPNRPVDQLAAGIFEEAVQKVRGRLRDDVAIVVLRRPAG
jgi:PAS domain S-box-containing protein